MRPGRAIRIAAALAGAAAVAAVALWIAARPVEPAPRPAPPRVVIIGVDGVDWDIMQAAVAAGRMPNVERMVREGASGILHSIPPYISPSVWTTIATGKREEKHGIRSFLAERAHGALTAPTTSNPETAAYPPELVQSLGDFIVRAEDLSDGSVARLLGTTRHLSDPKVAAREVDLRRYLASDLTTLGLARHLMRSVPTDVSGVYFRGVDLACHTFWRYRSPGEWPDGLDSSETETFEPVIDRYYAVADSLIGEIVRAAGDAVFVVCSDHGFDGHGARAGGAGPRIGTAMHREMGVIVMAGPGIRRGATIEGASVLDVTPTVLAILGVPIGRDMDGRVLTDAITERALSERPIIFIETHEGSRPSGGGEPIPSPVDDEIKEMLRSLGYIE